MVVLENTPVDAEATPLQSINATLYQLDRCKDVRRIDGKRVVLVPEFAVNAIRTWLLEAKIQLIHQNI